MGRRPPVLRTFLEKVDVFYAFPYNLNNRIFLLDLLDPLSSLQELLYLLGFIIFYESI